MSPLAPSVLALAVLLATAASEEYNCVYKMIGKRDGVTLYFITEVTKPFKTYDFDDMCHGDKPYGEHVAVCNNSPNHPPPTIDGPPPGKFHPVNVTCEDVSDGCIAFFVMYCPDTPDYPPVIPRTKSARVDARRIMY